MKTMTMQEHADKVHLIIDNTEPLYRRKIAIFKVSDKGGGLDKLKDQLRQFSDDAVIATNLSESSDPFISGVLFLRVAGLVYIDLLTEYIGGEW